jgi:hypothetical protein
VGCGHHLIWLLSGPGTGVRTNEPTRVTDSIRTIILRRAKWWREVGDAKRLSHRRPSHGRVVCAAVANLPGARDKVNH